MQIPDSITGAGLGYFMLTMKCLVCHKDYELKITVEQYHELYQSPNSRHIQDVLPEMSAGDRELMISGTCDACFDEMFVEDES